MTFVSPQKGDLTVEIKDGKADAGVMLMLSFARKLRPGERVHGRLKLVTDDEVDREILVPYRAYTAVAHD